MSEPDWIPAGAEHMQRQIEYAEFHSRVIAEINRGLGLAEELNRTHRIESDHREKE